MMIRGGYVGFHVGISNKIEAKCSKEQLIKKALSQLLLPNQSR